MTSVIILIIIYLLFICFLTLLDPSGLVVFLVSFEERLFLCFVCFSMRSALGLLFFCFLFCDLFHYYFVSRDKRTVQYTGTYMTQVRTVHDVPLYRMNQKDGFGKGLFLIIRNLQWVRQLNKNLRRNYCR